MPTLQPQTLSGLVVIPTVESQPGLHRVSIAIDVGVSRTPPPQVVTREDLVVELRAGAEGPLEAIASPDPGPLPTRALRVVQARGEFTFAQGVNPPSDLKVTLRGDQKTFPMSQAFAPTGGCFAKQPAEGDPFPASRRSRRFPSWWPFKTASCCVKRFDAPLNSTTDPTAKSEYFEIEADFVQRGRRCRCVCCEYRQFVRGTFTDANGAAVRFDLPSGALRPGDYCEDGAIDEFGPGAHGYYGHRSTSTPGDTYGGTPGCKYRGHETAGCPPSDTAQLEFLGLVVDACRNRVAATRTWTVNL
jgi:hypothetical protein